MLADKNISYRLSPLLHLSIQNTQKEGMAIRMRALTDHSAAPRCVCCYTWRAASDISRGSSRGWGRYRSADAALVYGGCTSNADKPLSFSKMTTSYTWKRSRRKRVQQHGQLPFQKSR